MLSKVEVSPFSSTLVQLKSALSKLFHSKLKTLSREKIGTKLNGIFNWFRTCFKIGLTLLFANYRLREKNKNISIQGFFAANFFPIIFWRQTWTSCWELLYCFNVTKAALKVRIIKYKTFLLNIGKKWKIWL